MVSPRIQPLAEPYPADFATAMKALMRGADPLVLFTTLASQPRAWAKFAGGGMLDRDSPLSLRQRELVIDRTTARCGCEYEWGVHATTFADRAGLTPDQLAATVIGAADDRAWEDPAERTIVVTVDALLEHKRLDDDQWAALRGAFDEAQALEIVQLVAFYHGVSLICGALDLPLESNAARFPAAPGE